MSEEKMTSAGVYPYFFQYEVRPNDRNAGYGTLAGAIATVMVFAGTDEQARARAARHVGRNNWRIVEVKREMHILRHHVENMEGVLKSVYLQAEQTGIAAAFDGWKKPAPRGK